jgi:hypothetical protein
MSIVKDGSGNAITPDNPLNMKITKRYATTIQTHNSVSVPLSGYSRSTTWIDCDGYSDIAITLTNDASANSYIDVIWSNDGINEQGLDGANVSNANQRKAVSIPVKARYAKVALGNNDGTLAHTMSAWVYLKA